MAIEIIDAQSLAQRTELLLTKWRDATDDTDIEFRIGHTDTGIPALLISVGEVMVPFTKPEGISLVAVLKEANSRGAQMDMLESGVRMAVKVLP